MFQEYCKGARIKTEKKTIVYLELLTFYSFCFTILCVCVWFSLNHFRLVLMYADSMTLKLQYCGDFLHCFAENSISPRNILVTLKGIFVTYIAALTA